MVSNIRYNINANPSHSPNLNQHQRTLVNKTNNANMSLGSKITRSVNRKQTNMSSGNLNVINI